RAMDKLLSNYRLTLKHHNVRHHYIREAVASGWKQHIMYNMFSEKLYTWDIVGGHAEIIHTERIIVWNLEEKIHILEKNNIKIRDTVIRLCYFFNEINSKVLDIEALDNLQRELICGPHFLHYITEIPDQELLHKAHFLILQSAEDVSKYQRMTIVTTLMDTLSTQREAYKDDPFILAKHANQIWNEFALNKNNFFDHCINIVLDVSKKFVMPTDETHTLNEDAQALTEGKSIPFQDIFLICILIIKKLFDDYMETKYFDYVDFNSKTDFTVSLATIKKVAMLGYFLPTL
ncbi:hypothetical protein ACJX0J_041919, partial [Zea mays]